MLNVLIMFKEHSTYEHRTYDDFYVVASFIVQQLNSGLRRSVHYTDKKF